jgi:uncharacterized membrane protein required for colicin V production
MLGPYDVLVLAVLAIGWVLGRAKGFAWQVSGIATLVLGFIAATAGSSSLAPFFPDTWPLDLRRFAAWTAIYGGVSVVIYLITLALSKKLKELELDDLDRRFGGTLGAVKSGLALTVVSLVAVAGSERARTFVQRSLSGFALARVGSIARPLLPEKIAAALDRCLERIDPDAALPRPGERPSPAPPTLPSRSVGSPGPRPRTTLAPRLDGGNTPRPPAPSPSPPSEPPEMDDDPPPPRDSGKTIEPEPAPSASEPLDPLAPAPKPH